MSQADLIIKGGKVVTEHGIHEHSIAVKDGKIVAVGDQDQMPSAARAIDVGGQHVFPGIKIGRAHV